MKTLKYIILGLLIISSVGMMADSYSYTVALRTGASVPIGFTPSTRGIGGVGGVEFYYTRLFYRIHEKGLGLRFGLGVDYTYTKFGTRYQNSFTNFDYKGNEMIYSVSARPSQSQQNIQIVIPIMFVYRHSGLLLGAGIRLGVPLWNQYSAGLQDVSIEALYTKTGVTVKNELITGQFDPALTEISGKNTPFPINPMLAFDLGYEFHWGHNKLGLSLFVEGCPIPFNNKKEAESMLYVKPITDPSNPPAEVVYTPNSSRSGIPYVNVGLRIYYSYFSRIRTRLHGRIVTPE